jgi:hypothetical protein
MTAAVASSKEDPTEEEEEDEDYNPDEDMQVDEEDEAQQADPNLVGIPSCTLSEVKRKAVDEAFEELFGYKFGTRFVPKRRKTGEPRGKTEDLLIRIFGPTVAAQILATSDTVTKIQVKRAPLPTNTVTTVTEVKRYAGQTIRVKRKVNASDTAASLPSDQTKPQGIDSLLQELNGPGKLSTVAKTSADWDSFKQDAGVEDEIEKQAQGKNAYLHKQDFLKRVDERSFVQEKAQRDQDRSKRGK